MPDQNEIDDATNQMQPATTWMEHMIMAKSVDVQPPPKPIDASENVEVV